MRPELIAACQMFLVPSAIMFAALGVASSEGLKTVICAMGATTSDMWFWTVYRWKDVAIPGVDSPPSDTRPVLLLAFLFAVAWGVCFIVHLVLGIIYGFERQKEVQHVFLTRPKPAFTFRRFCRRFWRRLMLPVRHRAPA
jgi:hypothetical protein